MVQIFVTGGTFDKEYNYITGELTFFETHLTEMLKRGRCGLDTQVTTLMMKDSLQITDEDRLAIVQACRECDPKNVLITHGTDTMVETATFLAHRLAKDKTVVLMGAMIPYTFGTSSDGFFNLGSGLAFVQTLSPGVYVAMNGRYFPWDNVRKNYNTGFFESLV